MDYKTKKEMIAFMMMNSSKKFKIKKITLSYMDTSLDFDNSTYPYCETLHNDFIFVNPSLGNFKTFQYSNIVVDTDFGILFTASDSQINLQLVRIIHNHILNNHSERYKKTT